MPRRRMRTPICRTQTSGIQRQRQDSHTTGMPPRQRQETEIGTRDGTVRSQPNPWTGAGAVGRRHRVTGSQLPKKLGGKLRAGSTTSALGTPPYTRCATWRARGLRPRHYERIRPVRSRWTNRRHAYSACTSTLDLSTFNGYPRH
jgi:hypothetical protein